MRDDLPAGTVTFLFTDVEGSTELLREIGSERYAEVLAEHRRVLRETFAVHGGVEVDTQGDAFFVAFNTAPDALEASAEATLRLADGPIRVRMGLHTGTPHLADAGYVGMDVHRAARIAACGHGGQVLVSASTAALAEPGMLLDLGDHRLKDLSATERIFQVGDEDFPPLRSLNATNLPEGAGPLIGRQDELAAALQSLRGGTRLVTITGPGGTGKTRFGIQIGAELVGDFADGVFWVPLQALSEADLVLPVVAQTLGAGDDVASHLQGRETLLLLDNLEHLLDAAPALADLLARCPKLRVLVTSRAPLRIAGEHELPLDPLPEGDAAALFVERARDVGRELAPDDTVAAICRRLDNLPLALELAAARTRLLDAPALLERLERSLSVLTGGRRDAPQRHQTLRATIDWSYELLDEHTQHLFMRLAVFAGSFSLDSAAEICDADLEGLSALVELALLKPIGEDRLLMLETIGEYARERLEGSGEYDSLRDRHAQHFLAFVPRMHSPGRPEPEDDEEAFGVAIPLRESLDRVEAEYANVRAALQWLIASGRAEQALRLTHALTVGFLMSRGRRGEIRPLLDSALARADEVSPRARTDALTTLAVYAPDLDPAARRELAAEGLALARQLEDKPRIQRALRTLARYQDDPRDRQTMLLECEALARELDDLWALGWTQFFLGEAALENGDYEEANGRLEEALALFEGFSAVLEVPQSLAMLAFIALLGGRAGDAERLFRRSLERVLELGERVLAVSCVEGLASVAVENGEAARAVRLLGAAASVREELDEEEVAPYHQRMRDESLARARKQLGDGFDREWEAGRGLAYDEAAALALADY